MKFSTTELRGMAVVVVGFMVILAIYNYVSLEEEVDRDRVSLPVVEEDGSNAEEVSAILADSLDLTGEVKDLIIQDTLIGDGDTVVEGDTVRVEYIGALTNGHEFDRSSNHGDGTFTFTLGGNQVIEGWDKGVVGMKEGGKRTLVIPSHMGYGERNLGTIPPNSTLLFAVTLLEIL